MPYSLATYAGAIQGNVGGNLVIYPDAAIQSATGSIDIGVGGNLDLTGNNPNGAQIGADLGAIRTTGETRGIIRVLCLTTPMKAAAPSPSTWQAT